jgi:hypothetical protein
LGAVEDIARAECATTHALAQAYVGVAQAASFVQRRWLLVLAPQGDLAAFSGSSDLGAQEMMHLAARQEFRVVGVARVPTYVRHAWSPIGPRIKRCCTRS